MKATLFFVSGCVLLSGCGPGVADFEEQIGNSDLVYISTGPIQRYINKTNSDGTQVTLLRPRVLGYVVLETIVVVAKQPSTDWECADRSLMTTIEKRLEYWTISTDNYKVSGPFEFHQLGPMMNGGDFNPDLRSISPEAFRGELIEEKNGTECTEPRQI